MALIERSCHRCGKPTDLRVRMYRRRWLRWFKPMRPTCTDCVLLMAREVNP